MDQSLRQIAGRTVGPWLDSREAEIRAARAAGQRAATSDIALLQRRHADFQDGLLGRAKSAVLALQSELGTYASDLRRQIGDLARERDDHIGQRMQDLREERQRVLHALDGSKGPLSAPWTRAALANEEAERAHRAVRAEVNGRPLRRALVGIYLPLMVLLALVEVPVNRLAFELFFQEQPIISLALAAVVGAVLIFFAHMIGTLVRRMEHQPRPVQQVKRGLAILLFATLTGVMMYLLAGMRQLYVRLLESEQSSNLSAIIQGLTSGGTASAIRNVASEQLGTAGWTLLILNLVLFVFGATAAFVRHDPHPDYEAAWRSQERARGRLTRLRTRYDRVAGAKSREFDAQLAALDQLMRETAAKHDELLVREAAIEPFLLSTTGRIANTVRNRSLAFLEGAIAAIPKGPTEGSLGTVQAMSEEEVRRRISEGVSEPAS
ncbi:MAG: hypothetical protein JOZ05_16880 [Acetobacteraceae bacterium]|nr:hypothetical protein [Acetobacteraceae bacterium]